MSISDKLQSISNCKVAIKNAIETKGVEVGSAPLASYAEKILQIETGVELGDKITETNAEAYLEAKEFKF